MKRSDFIKIIKLRSYWKIDKRHGNYRLPNGELLSQYVEDLVRGQMELDDIEGITASGDLESCTTTGHDEAGLPIYEMIIPFAENETCSYDTMERRIQRLVYEIVG